jgi:hypothetical protein
MPGVDLDWKILQLCQHEEGDIQQSQGRAKRQWRSGRR